MEISEDTVRKVTQPRDKAVGMDTKRLLEKMKNNEPLQLKLESALANQMAEKAAMITLTNENAMLKKHHHDMKVRLEAMQREFTNLLDELDHLKRAEHRQQIEITRLQRDIEELRLTQGGDSNMRDMQDRLIRLTDDQAQKDLKIYKLEMMLKDSSWERGEPPKSAVCVVM